MRVAPKTHLDHNMTIFTKGGALSWIHLGCTCITTLKICLQLLRHGGGGGGQVWNTRIHQALTEVTKIYGNSNEQNASIPTCSPSFAEHPPIITLTHSLFPSIQPSTSSLTYLSLFHSFILFVSLSSTIHPYAVIILNIQQNKKFENSFLEISSIPHKLLDQVIKMPLPAIHNENVIYERVQCMSFYFHQYSLMPHGYFTDVFLG